MLLKSQSPAEDVEATGVLALVMVVEATNVPMLFHSPT